MNKYFQLIFRDGLVKKSFYVDKWDLNGCNITDFEIGRQINQWPKSAVFTTSRKQLEGDLDDFIVNDAFLLLIRSRLLEVIKKLKVPEYQALPAEVVWSDHRTETCFLLNFVEHVSCLNLEYSKVLYYPNDFSTLSLRGKISTSVFTVLFKEQVDGWDFFRCQECPTLVFVSDHFKSQFKLTGMTGVAFSPTKVI